MTTLEAFNQALFLMINGTTATPAWQVAAALLIADYLIWLVPLLLVGMWLSRNEKQRGLAIFACLVAMLGVGGNQLIGLVWQHPRPFMIGLGHTFLAHAPDSSFPSDHATVFVGIALTLLLGGMRRLGGLTLLIGAAVAWARVFLGVHFPLDMIRGRRRCRCLRRLCVNYATLATWRYTSNALGDRAVPQAARTADRPRLAAPLI